MSNYVGIKKVEEVSNIARVNELLTLNWEILHICTVSFTYESTQEDGLPRIKESPVLKIATRTHYVMGKR
ncbi:MAG: hypothetical protein UV60_C0006G0050 [Parcubacteria group bacterium GW2011_GWA2_43_11]|nr:MAG: hypothetical protein UV60_C0006G0050 [Parcubacteria group bacterium GW2011_GWA2_43_11]